MFRLLHPLFLIPYAIFMVCFNLTDLLDPSTRSKSLNELEFWLGSIVVHTRTEADGKATLSSIVLVGTHYDSPGLTPHKLVEINEAIDGRLIERYDLAQRSLIRRPGDKNVSSVSLSRAVNLSYA